METPDPLPSAPALGTGPHGHVRRDEAGRTLSVTEASFGLQGNGVERSKVNDLFAEAWGHLNKAGKVWEAESLHQLQRAEEILNPSTQMRGDFFVFSDKKGVRGKAQKHVISSEREWREQRVRSESVCVWRTGKKVAFLR